MAEVTKIPRLGRAAREFNVGISTIISLLKKKNIEIQDSPNTKLTPEIYEILLLEFQGDIIDKKNANQIASDLSSPKNKQEDGVEEVEKTKPQQPDITPIIESPVVAENAEVPISTPITTPGVKIIGHIDLEETNGRKSTKKAKTTKKEASLEDTPIVTSPTADQDDIVKTETKKHVQPTIDTEKGAKIDETDADTTTHIESNITTGDSEEEKIEETVSVEPPADTEPQPKEEILSNVEEIKEEITESPIISPTTEPDIPYIAVNAPIIPGIKIVGSMTLPEKKVKGDVQKEKEKEKEKEKGKEKVSESKKIDKKRKRIRRPAGTTHKEGGALLIKKPEVPKNEITSEELVKQINETLQRMGPVGKSKTSKYKKRKRQTVQVETTELEKQKVAEQKHLKVPEYITTNELATLMNIPVDKIISTCLSIDLFVSINQRLDAETISLLTDAFGFQVTFVGIDVEDDLHAEEKDAIEDLEPRHPIIAVMGHVDHGKTSLLDYIRKTNVIAGEAGGITQHIGAYEVQLSDDRRITLLDTPGHEAFTAMRARGAKVTDLCIIVIAADDSIMPQTVEAINHAQAAGVPMVFAITKIDKPHANPEKIKEGLANMNILVEDWGGKYQCQEIDAKHGTNVSELLEKVLLEAELLELKANPNRPGMGTVIESSLDKGKGYVAKILVQNGTLRHGDPIFAGPCYGKVKALYNERNQLVKAAVPSTPVLMLGLNGAPQAGDIFKVCASEHDARITANKRMQLIREMGLRTQKHITLEEIGRRLAIGDFKELNIIVKADVDGSAEALADELLKLSTEQVQVNVIHKSVGQVTDTDVMLASASNAIIVAFQVRPSPSSRKLAEQEQIDIRIYSIIYTAINEIKEAIEGMHTPEIHEKILTNLEVREVYKIGKVGNVAGCFVLDGKLQRNTKIRLIRDGIVIYTGKLGSLKRFKDDVKEVVAGQECGLNIENFNDIKIGDIIEGYEEYEVKVSL